MDGLRQALRRLAKAVVVITSQHEGVRFAMAATAVSELSFDPPSMLVCVNQSASLHVPLNRGAHFAINILDHSQLSIANRCAGAVKGEERFAEGEWLTTDLGVPRLIGAQANIMCRNVRTIEFGTHAIFIGEVEQTFTDGVADPLIYVDGRYTRVEPVVLA